MYSIVRSAGCLMMKFNMDFGFPMIRAIIHHETAMAEYPDTNDIWMIGAHRAGIHMGELESMVTNSTAGAPAMLHEQRQPWW